MAGGKPGPAPKPTKLAVLEGGKPRTDEPVPGAGDVECPGWLSGDARAMWERLAPDMKRQGVLTAWDVDAFAVVCASYVSWREAQQIVDREGVLVEGYRGSMVKNPAAQLARDYWQTFAQGAARFGLTPSDRAALSIGGESRDDAERYFSSG